MPVDRFIHPRLGHSDKVNLLTDLEFRVWVQYMLSADDFGVMRMSAVTVQSDNDHLSNRPKRIVDRCLAALVKCGLLLPFEHQNRQYVCQWDWQDWQHIGYPRATIQPLPPPEILEQCSPKTLRHFERHPQSVPRLLTKDLPNVPEMVPESSSPSRARERLTAKTNGSDEQTNGDAAARFIERYQALYVQHRNGAKLHLKPNLDWTRVCDLLVTWDAARLEKLAVILLTTDDEWVTKTDRSIGVFASRASWCDDRLRAWEQANGVAV